MPQFHAPIFPVCNHLVLLNELFMTALVQASTSDSFCVQPRSPGWASEGVTLLHTLLSWSPCVSSGWAANSIMATTTFSLLTQTSMDLLLPSWLCLFLELSSCNDQQKPLLLHGEWQAHCHSCCFAPVVFRQCTVSVDPVILRWIEPIIHQIF